MMAEEPTLVISEIFRSIQGESTYAGFPCVFVRLTGCDLRCNYCDTEYAFYGGNRRTLSSIVEEVLQLQTPLVEITGGEPLLQQNVHALMTALLNRNLSVLLETSGAHDISACDPRVKRVMDLKCPSSGEMEKNLLTNISHLRSTDEVKFVIRNRADFDWASQIVREYDICRRCSVLFSPVWKELSIDMLAEWTLSSQLNVRIQTQLHKIIWGERPGV